MSSSALHHTATLAHTAVHDGVKYAVGEVRDNYFKESLPVNCPATRRESTAPDYDGQEKGRDAHVGASEQDKRTFTTSKRRDAHVGASEQDKSTFTTSKRWEGSGWIAMLIILFILWYRYHVEGYKVVIVLPVLLFWHRLGKYGTRAVSLLIWYWYGLRWWKILILDFFLTWH